MARDLLEEGLSSEGALSSNLVDIFDKLGWFDDKSPLEAEEFAAQILEWGNNALKWSLITESTDSINQFSSSNIESLKNILGEKGGETITGLLNDGKEYTQDI
jgi:hypothetical protein